MDKIKQQADMLKRNDFNGYYKDLITFVNEQYEKHESNKKRNTKKVNVVLDDKVVATSNVEDVTDAGKDIDVEVLDKPVE